MELDGFIAVFVAKRTLLGNNSGNKTVLKGLKRGIIRRVKLLKTMNISSVVKFAISGFWMFFRYDVDSR